jgi:hypothetical protein
VTPDPSACRHVKASLGRIKIWLCPPAFPEDQGPSRPPRSCAQDKDKASRRGRTQRQVLPRLRTSQGRGADAATVDGRPIFQRRGSVSSPPIRRSEAHWRSELRSSSPGPANERRPSRSTRPTATSAACLRPKANWKYGSLQRWRPGLDCRQDCANSKAASSAACDSKGMTRLRRPSEARDQAPFAKRSIGSRGVPLQVVMNGWGEDQGKDHGTEQPADDGNGKRL